MLSALDIKLITNVPSFLRRQESRLFYSHGGTPAFSGFTHFIFTSGSQDTTGFNLRISFIIFVTLRTLSARQIERVAILFILYLKSQIHTFNLPDKQVFSV